ncbi:hypothetical protein SAMN03097699_1171 [Flavobacteriaceae bacterium MAR_2010_188]|nr:hypothetical protein SAMN03097699_1171 [Flavobacteriaceae bacterium MAR_2010_188]
MNDKKIPGQDNKKKGIKENAINQKQNQSDGKEINEQVKQKQEKHQPRDNA